MMESHQQPEQGALHSFWPVSAEQCTPLTPAGASSEIVVPYVGDNPAPLAQIPEATDNPRLPDVTDTPTELDDPNVGRDNYWQADPDILDSIRTELSTATPAAQRMAAAMVATTIKQMEDTYGRFIPEATKHAAARLPERVVLCDEHGLAAFTDVWEEKQSAAETDIPRPVAIFSTEGNIIATLDNDALWNDIQSQLDPEELSATSEARALAANEYMAFLLGHETAHQYQDSDLPPAFLESGADYYERQLTAARAASTILPIRFVEDVGAVVYAKLLGHFGDDVHRLYFGSLHDPKRAAEIVSTLTEPVLRLLGFAADDDRSS